MNESQFRKPDTVLEGRYLLGEALEDWDNSILYAGFDPLENQKVAVKEYFPFARAQRLPDGTVAPGENLQDRFDQGKVCFLKEAQLLKNRKWPGQIVTVFDFFEAEGTAYMVMEYLRGKNLRELVQEQGAMQPEDCMENILPPAMFGLTEVYRQGLLHLDISPENIKVSADGTWKLDNFGYARAMDPGRECPIFPTPGFAPIELYQLRANRGEFSDVYSLCATIYYCITGLVPPTAIERVLAVTKDQTDPLEKPSELGISTDSKLEDAILWGLELLPTNRPQTMDAWLRAVEFRKPPPTPEPKKWPYIFLLIFVMIILIGITVATCLAK